MMVTISHSSHVYSWFKAMAPRTKVYPLCCNWSPQILRIQPPQWWPALCQATILWWSPTCGGLLPNRAFFKPTCSNYSSGNKKMDMFKATRIQHQHHVHSFSIHFPFIAYDFPWVPSCFTHVNHNWICHPPMEGWNPSPKWKPVDPRPRE